MKNLTALSVLVLLLFGCRGGGPETLDPLAQVAARVAPEAAFQAPPRDPRDSAATRDSGSPVLAETAPPPIIGGTLLASRDGTRLVATDPARGEVWVLALPSGSILARQPLEVGAEAGRIVEDEAGSFHFVLRVGGDLVSMSRDGVLTDRRHVCAAPRGLAVQGDTLHVACAEGLLVTFVVAGGPAQRIVDLGSDLRDVVVDSATGDLAVSVFRSAEVLFLDGDGVIVARRRPPNHETAHGDLFTPNVAWRMRPAAGGGVLLLHQRSQATPLHAGDAGGGGYGGTECSVGVVQTVLSHVSRDQERPAAPTILGLTLAVDFDVHGDRTAVVAPGVLATPREGVVLRAQHQVRHLSIAEATAPGGPGVCVSGPSLAFDEFAAQLTSVASLPSGEWVLQGREPAIIVRDGGTVTTLPTHSIADDGHAFFHQRPGVAITCASCHPEGGEDGHTWRFTGVGARRTQTLRGPILDSAPFHWGGDVPTFAAIAHGNIEDRMGGPEMHGAAITGMARFVEAIPHLPRVESEDPEAVERGARLFAAAEVGCADCHRGPRLSDDRTVDVGTGRPFQVPGLRGLRYRAPYLHDGRAETLYDLFYSARTDRHGDVAHLSDDQVADLVSFLESL